jgi:EAL domain-containing protein (putative c-di-GMP-specific phosphodiesterase class I)
VLQAIVSIGRALGLRVIVEGIETTEQLSFLRSLGVDLGQGYLFGAPCEAESAEAVFKQQPTLCYS